MGKLIDLTGMKFDKLTVMRRVEDYIDPSGKPLIMWECECECGNKTIVRGVSLRHHHTKSCGCLKNEAGEKIRKKLKKYNKYDLSGDFGIGYTFKGEFFYFDLEDYDLIKNYCWYTNNDGYIVTHAIDDLGYVSQNLKISFHRLVTSAPDGMSVDHINHVKYDNRKKNLRVITQQQNTINKGISKNNKSGTPGVFYQKFNNKWKATICINRKQIILGTFTSKEDAIKARKEAEEKYFGEYSYDNSMKGDENNE